MGQKEAKMADKKNEKKTHTSLPRNTLRVEFTRRVRGFIVRGHAHLGVAVARDHQLRDRFEAGFFVLRGEVYARLTAEALAAVARDGGYEDFVLSLARDGGVVRVEVDLDGSTSTAEVDVALVPRLRDFLRDGSAMGRAIADFLAGRGVPTRGGKKPSSGRRAVAALGRKGKARGDGKPRGTGAKLGDVASLALGEVGKQLTRAQATRHSGGKKGKGPKPVPASEPGTAPVEAVAPAPAKAEAPVETPTPAPTPKAEEPTIRGRQVRMYLTALEANGGDLKALPLSAANRAVVRDAAVKHGIVINAPTEEAE